MFDPAGTSPPAEAAGRCTLLPRSDVVIFVSTRKLFVKVFVSPSYREPSWARQSYRESLLSSPSYLLSLTGDWTLTPARPCQPIIDNPGPAGHPLFLFLTSHLTSPHTSTTSSELLSKIAWLPVLVQDLSAARQEREERSCHGEERENVKPTQNQL